MSTTSLWQRFRGPRTVRPRTAGVPVFVCVLIFATTAIVVNRLGRERWVPINTRPTFTATAYAVDRVTGEKTSFVSTDKNPRQAAEAADELADRYSAEKTSQWRRSMEQKAGLAHEMAQKARQDHAEAVERLNAFEQQQRDAVKSQANAAPQEKPRPTMIENPGWRQLHQHVLDLEQRRDQLLQIRTAEHPAVQEMARRLAKAEEQLAAVPQQIAGTPAAPAAVAVQPTNDLASKKDQQKRDELTAAVKRTRLACDRAELAEKQVAKERRSGPKIDIENAKFVQNEPQIDYGWRRLLWTTFAASFLLTFGIGSVAVGTRIEPPVASVEEVESALGKPVIGTMPADNPAVNLSAIHHQTQARRASIVLGMFLIVACPAVAIWGVLGI
jgi:hypothetical protein